MNTAICLLAALVTLAHAQVSSRTVGSLVMEDVPEIPAAVAARMLQYQNTRSADLADFSPDGDGLLIRTRFGETLQLHWLKAPGGARTQLTFFPEPIGGAALRPVPGAREAVYVMDQAGTENFQLHLLRLKDGTSKLLTDGKSRNESPLWSRDGSRLAFNSTARNGKDFDFHLYDAAKGETRLLLPVEGQWSSLDWSLDGAKLLVKKYVSINESYLYMLDVAAGRLEPLFPGQEGRKVSYAAARWTADGGVLFTSDEAGEFVRLGVVDLKTRKVRWLSADIPWNVGELAVSRDGKKAAFLANEDGFGALYAGPAAGPFRAVPGLPRGILYSLEFDGDGRRLGFVANTPTSPGDIYTAEWGSWKATRWTQSETGGLPPETFVAPELIRFKSFDGREIPAYYYKPRGKGPFPLVVAIHGGPEAQELPYFAATYQYWLNELGVAVIAPNVRGSDGYGKSYLQLDNGYQREDSVKDIGALLDWAAARAELDKSRFAVYGGSYGGYMVLASLVKYADRLKAGVDVVGISNFVTFLKNTAPYRVELRRAEYGDERDPKMEAFQQSISPLNVADRIRSALFVIQGANDPRVPLSEADQIVREVRGKGNKAWYMVAKDEGHGFQKKTNRDAMGQAVTLFWERHLIK